MELEIHKTGEVCNPFFNQLRKNLKASLLILGLFLSSSAFADGRNGPHNSFRNQIEDIMNVDRTGCSIDLINDGKQETLEALKRCIENADPFKGILYGISVVCDNPEYTVLKEKECVLVESLKRLDEEKEKEYTTPAVKKRIEKIKKALIVLLNNVRLSMPVPVTLTNTINGAGRNTMIPLEKNINLKPQ